MTKHTLKAQKRDILGRKVKNLRLQGLIPASLFGKEIKSQNLTLDSKEFSKTYSQVGESGLIYLLLDSSKSETPVIFSEVTRNPLTDEFLHVSLRQVNLTEKITAPVKIEIIGKSPAVTEGLGVMVQQADELEIEALPQDLPENITVDVTSLSEVGNSILAKDLHLGSKLNIVSPIDTIIVKIEPLAKEEVVAPPPVVEGVVPAPDETVVAPPITPAPEEKK